MLVGSCACAIISILKSPDLDVYGGPSSNAGQHSGGGVPHSVNLCFASLVASIPLRDPSLPFNHFIKIFKILFS